MNPRQLLFTGQCGRIVIPAVLRPQLYAHPARRFRTYPGPCAMSAQPPPSNNGPSPSGPSTVTSQQTVRTPQQLVRRWVRLEQQSTSGPQHSAKLRLLSWNLLADGLAQWGDFIRVREQPLRQREHQHRLLRGSKCRLRQKGPSRKAQIPAPIRWTCPFASQRSSAHAA